MISTLIFEAVRSGRMTPEAGAEWLEAMRGPGLDVAVMVLAVAIGVLLGVC